MGKYGDDKDRRKVSNELQAWYEGDEIITKIAEDIRSRLDKVTIPAWISGSEYNNNFWSGIVSIVQEQIPGPDYTGTKEPYIKNQHYLEECNLVKNWQYIGSLNYYPESDGTCSVA